MLKKLGFKWRLVERWTEEECTQFEQNVIEHGWGNWKKKYSLTIKCTDQEPCNRSKERSAFNSGAC